MTIETKFGKFKIHKNYRDGFEKDAFEKRYIPEVYDKFNFIVGDVSSGILRLKGFHNPHANNTHYRNIPIYLAESCNFNTAYYILERVKDNDNK